MTPTDAKLLLDELREWLPATSEDSRHIADRLEAEIQAKSERVAELEKENERLRVEGVDPARMPLDARAELKRHKELLDRVAELEKTLRNVLALAEVLYEGDPWFAEDAQMDANEILKRGREEVSGETPE